MTAVKKYDSVNGGTSFDGFVGAKSKLGQPLRWGLSVKGEAIPLGTDWRCSSPFGSVESAVVVDEKGEPVFDRPLYREAPNVNVVVWGRDNAGDVRLAVISQPRPHADDPEQPGDSHRPVVFGQIVMGFMKNLLGEDNVAAYEKGRDAAAREAGEEAGVRTVLSIEQPPYPWHNPNPTFVATWSDLHFVEVNLERIAAHKSTRGEPIYKAEYVTVKELRQRIAMGRGPDGEVYRMCTALSAWFIFACCHPELAREAFA